MSGGEIIIVYGGLPGEPDHATIDGVEVIRRPGESLEDFVDYVRSLAKRGKESVIIVGGLPD